VSLERQIGTALSDAMTPASSSCVDAETLAAWASGSLAPNDAAVVDSHLAGCARCQAMLAAFAESEEPAAAARVLPFRQRPAVKWAASLAAAAAAATVIWIALPKHGAPLSTQEARVEPAPAPVPPPQVVAPTNVGRDFSPTGAAGSATSGSRPDVRGSVSAKAASASKPIAPVALEQPALVAPPPAPVPVPSPPPPPRPATTSTVDVKADTAILQAASGERSDVVQQQQLESLPVANRGFRDLVSLLPGVTASSSPQAGTAPATGASPPRVGGGGQDNIMIDGISVLDTGNNGLMDSPAAGAAGGRAGGGGGGRGAAVVIEFSSRAPEPTAATASTAARASGATSESVAQSPTRWRILPNRIVQRSITNGATWTPVAIDPAITLTNGSAPTPLVCWLIGRAGAVLRTTDGSTFAKVPFPLAADLLSILAVDGRQATVTTTTGLVYTTSDGGALWTRGP